MDVRQFMSPQRVFPLRKRTKEGALNEMVKATCSEVLALDPRETLEAILKREELVSSWVTHGIAFPHARIPDLGEFFVSIGISQKGINFHAADNTLVHLLVMILGDEQDFEMHLKILGEFSKILRNEDLLEHILDLENPVDVLDAFLIEKPKKKKKATVGKTPSLSHSVAEHALSLARENKARAILLNLTSEHVVPVLEDLPKNCRLLYAVNNRSVLGGVDIPENANIVEIPFLGLNRFNQVELSLLLCLSQGLFKKGDRVVCISGQPGMRLLDTVMIIDIGKEFNMFFSNRSVAKLGDLQKKVLDRMLHIATLIAREGREGKPVGAIFVVGDYDTVKRFTHQMVINPFKGYAEDERNVLDPSMEETLKEFSLLDGAIIIRGDGVIMSAGTYLRTEKVAVRLPPGYGARHAAAAAITATSRAIGIVISESTGTVRLFKGGKLFMALEKPLQLK